MIVSTGRRGLGETQQATRAAPPPGSTKPSVPADVQALAGLLAATGEAAVAHALRVRGYALDLADAIGLDPRQRRQLSLAARVHDVGKYAVPPGPLAERLGPELTPAPPRLEDHPVRGERVLRALSLAPEVLAAVRHQQERFDGCGHPDGLIGTDIPLLARILAVAEWMDLWTQANPGPPDRALGILWSSAGLRLDPVLVHAFVRHASRPPAAADPPAARRAPFPPWTARGLRNV